MLQGGLDEAVSIPIHTSTMTDEDAGGLGGSGDYSDQLQRLANRELGRPVLGATTPSGYGLLRQAIVMILSPDGAGSNVSSSISSSGSEVLLGVDDAVTSLLSAPTGDRSLQVVGKVKQTDVIRQSRGLLADLQRVWSCLVREPLRLQLWMQLLAVTDALSSDVAGRTPCLRLVNMASDELRGSTAGLGATLRASGSMQVYSVQMPHSWFGISNAARCAAIADHNQKMVLSIVSLAGLGLAHATPEAPVDGIDFPGRAEGTRLLELLESSCRSPCKTELPPETWRELQMECRQAGLATMEERRLIVSQLLLQRASFHYASARALCSSNDS